MRCVLPAWTVFFASCSAFIRVPGALPPVPVEMQERRFAPEELAADLQTLLAIVEEVHPDPYTVVPREEVLRQTELLIQHLDRPLLRREFWPLAAELVAAWGDGHTSLYAPQEEWRRAPQGASASLPLDVAWDGNALTVRRTSVVTADGALGPGTRVLSINAMDAGDLFRGFLRQQSGESESWRRGQVEIAFAMRLWLAGIESPFAVRCRSARDPSVEFEVDLLGVPWESLARGAVPGAGERWRLERRSDGTAILVLDTLAGDLDTFRSFARQTFTELQQSPPAALVVDLRKNGGGDTRLADELLQYLSDKPWRMSSRKEWKMSTRYRAFLKTFLAPWLRWLPLQYLHPLGWKLWRTSAGESAVLEFELEHPRKEPLRYRGPCAFLIGPGTFSSAASLAAAVKDCGLAHLAGEPTGGVTNGFGEVMPFELPATRLRGQVSSARFVRPSGDTSERRGVEPHWLLPSNPTLPGDPVLDEVVARLLPRGSSLAP